MNFRIERLEDVHVPWGEKRMGAVVQSKIIKANKVSASREARALATSHRGQFIRVTRERDGEVIGTWRQARSQKHPRRL